MLRTVAARLALVGALAVVAVPSDAQDRVPSGSVVIDQTQIALLVTGSLGGGTLEFQGKSYPFSIGNLGVGGIGVASFRAVGEVYNLTSVADFPGLYGAAGAGWAATDEGQGTVWLENPSGVVMRLQAEREGAILTAGVEGVLISME